MFCVEEKGMSANPVAFWEINASDGDRLCRFYKTVFDWEISTDATGFHSVASQTDRGEGIAGGVFTGKGRIRNHRALYVQVDSAAETVEKIRAAGGNVLL
jgi:predicted enzyme related to lactoylglutathione lyase